VVRLGAVTALGQVPTQMARHCAFVVSATQPGIGLEEDYHFSLVAGLDGVEGHVSLQSVNYPSHYMAVDSAGRPGQVVMLAGAEAGDASWAVVPGFLGSTFVSLLSASTNTAYAGGALTLSADNKAHCNFAGPAGHLFVSTEGGAGVAQTWMWNPPLPTPVPAALDSTERIVAEAVNGTATAAPAATGAATPPAAKKAGKK